MLSAARVSSHRLGDCGDEGRYVLTLPIVCRRSRVESNAAQLCRLALSGHSAYAGGSGGAGGTGFGTMAPIAGGGANGSAGGIADGGTAGPGGSGGGS